MKPTVLSDGIYDYLSYSVFNVLIFMEDIKFITFLGYVYVT